MRTQLFIHKNIISLVGFEFKSLLGRLLTGGLKVDRTKKNYLNLGCGSVIAKNFINIDFFFNKSIDFGADFRYPLRICDASIDGVFCEHTFEHFTYNTNQMLFKECHRILKPGGILRIIVPDLSLFIKNYIENNLEWFQKWEQLMFIASNSLERAKRRLKTPLEAISFVTQEYGHLSAWDMDTLMGYLKESGFSEIKRTSFMSGEDKMLLLDDSSEARRFVSIYLEAKK